jgi:hypothetical protein
MVFLMENWMTVCWGKECLTHETTYSASDSVSSTVGDDAKSCRRPTRHRCTP